MHLNLKRGFVEGVAAATICTGLFVAFWYLTLPPDLQGSEHSISRWWSGRSVSATFRLTAVLFVSSGLIGFVMGAFRPTLERHNRPEGGLDKQTS